MINIFHVKGSKTITAHFFDMWVTSGNDCGTAKTLFTAIENKFYASALPWNNFGGLSIDNANTMIGKHNLIASNTLKNPSPPPPSPPFSASHAHNFLSDVLYVNIKNISIDLDDWF